MYTRPLATTLDESPILFTSTYVEWILPLPLCDPKRVAVGFALKKQHTARFDRHLDSPILRFGPGARQVQNAIDPSYPRPDQFARGLI
jgi:hypothetical protein